MYNRQLDTFLTVAECGSFTAAASRLFISPSAVIQQINILERDMKAELFIRSRRGVTLTEAGAYLAQEARAMITHSEKVRARVADLAGQEKFICIGTSMMEKIRLLYELWVLFTAQARPYEIRMVTIQSYQPLPQQVELVEGIQDGISWQEDMEFFEICRIPLGLAVARDHPLANLKVFSSQHLKGQTVVVLRRGSDQPPLKNLHRELTELGASLLPCDEFSGSVIWDSSYYRRMLLTPLVWGDILVDLTLKPCQWDYTLPYGIFYRRELSPQAAEFLSFIRDTYQEGSTQPVVPVF